MTELRNKIKTALNESRMLVLGTQVLSGLYFRSVCLRTRLRDTACRLTVPQPAASARSLC